MKRENAGEEEGGWDGAAGGVSADLKVYRGSFGQSFDSLLLTR